MLRKINIHFLRPDRDVNALNGFISVYHGIIYLNADLGNSIDDNIKWVKVGLDDDKNILIIKPSKSPINAYPIEKIVNAKKIIGFPTNSLKLYRKRAQAFKTENNLVVSLA